LSYQVELSRRARKAFLVLPARDRRLIERRLLALANDPRPPGVKALTQASRGYYRLRVGDYRIIYTVQDDKLLVGVIRIGPRHSVYDDMASGT